MSVREVQFSMFLFENAEGNESHLHTLHFLPHLPCDLRKYREAAEKHLASDKQRSWHV